jgi:hypothetical protein
LLKDCYEELGITGNPAKLDEERAAVRDWFYALDGKEGATTTYTMYPKVGANANTGGTLYQFDGKEPILVVTDIQAEIPDWIK